MDYNQSFGQVVNEQPPSLLYNDRLVQSSDSRLNLRYLRDTQEDTIAAGRLVVEGFRNKFIHATSERRLPACARLVSQSFRGQVPQFYERHILAEYDGKVAGIVILKFKGDPKPRDEVDMREFSCCDLCGLICMDMGKESPGFGKCYLEIIAVDDQFRGKGIGGALLQKADQEALRRNCNTIYLHVVSDNRAKNLYIRKGYEQKNSIWCCGFVWCQVGRCVVNEMEKRLLVSHY